LHGAEHRALLHRTERRLQGHQAGRRDGGVELLVGLVLCHDILLDTCEVDAVAAKGLELAACPPDLIASDRGDEVRQIVPEPEQDAMEPLRLLPGVELVPRKLFARQDTLLVQERAVRTGLDLVQGAFAEEVDLSFGAAEYSSASCLARDPPRKAATIRPSSEHASTNRAITAS